MTAWKIGDRVMVSLPVKRNMYSKSQWFAGTVREIDPPGMRPGVKIDLDEEVNGVRECFATHAELRLAG